MEAPGLEQLLDFQRWPDDGLLRLLLMLYFPFGVCLTLLRIFVGVHVFLVSCALPHSFIRRFVVRVMCSVLGIYVRQNSPRLRERAARLFVCNHVTPFDHNVINIIAPCNTPMLGGSSGFMCWARGFLELGMVSGRSGLAEALQQYCMAQGTLPLLLFPEEDITNGRHGLLKFSSWPFTVTDTVQPVALIARRPLLAVSTAESSWVTELLWTLFVPFTVYQVRWLAPMSRRDGDSSQDFANRVQEVIAGELGLVPTQITKGDKAEHIKRRRHIVPWTRSSNTVTRAQAHSAAYLAPRPGVEDAQMAKMAQQVKEVLPDFPVNIIMRDLMQTNCVNTTITNLLEGSREPEMEALAGAESTPGESSAPAMSRHANPPWSAANTFGNCQIDRHMSLQERKEALYEYARRRYIEKHGLNEENVQ
ncbi:lipid droplet-regulating VLDL assembly factor AUP1 [Brienomyrus brachyistius]|uniref:lipid droplet-regulating VLDL assembly factor AUP1 n=1 Tax=Brienomyrus brachyistius TaxID=42636 RepID=UPI0020B2AF28|nr:lipid droplet-regulating VLDL assembly factor AUP1 [Brienomyrus brachyistius]